MSLLENFDSDCEITVLPQPNAPGTAQVPPCTHLHADTLDSMDHRVKLTLPASYRNSLITLLPQCMEYQYIGVNFYNAARLELPYFLGCKAFRPLSPPPHFFQLHFLKTKDKNEITANNQTSFMEIDRCKLQAVRRSVLISEHCNSRWLVA